MNDRDDIPKEITTEWIERQSDVLYPLEAYMTSLQDQLGPYYKDAVESLPAGYLLLFLHWRFWTDVQNGGFGQFIGNALAIDDSGVILLDTLAALRQMGLEQLSDMLREALLVMSSELPQSVLAAVSAGTSREQRLGGTEQPSSYEVIEEQLDPLDRKVNRMNFSWFPRVSEFIRAHAEMFVHAGITDV